MAADQLNKRSKASNAVGHPWEQQKSKKKKFSCYDLNMRSSISLEWDEKKKNVVPKKEQICIAHRELASFLPVVRQRQSVLGDVFAAPPELFNLDNLTDLLSYEVWQTHLSEQERVFLIQLLPEGTEPHKIVDELLAGNNFFFGNPFLKWGASLCSGDCHPDAVLRQEQCNKANKKAYYTELQKYHTRMIGSLQLWKERWASCKNSGNDFMQKIMRARKDFDKSGSSHMNDILCAPEDNFGPASESCSWDADDKAYSSDSPNLTMMHGEASKRVFRNDFENKYYDSSDGWRSVARSIKGEKLHRRNIECGDGTKYMSYIKVSKEQHQRLMRSMKHSNTSIQHRSLNHVLGDLDTFCVQPYEVFVEEERQRLHEHWLHLAKKDVPAGFDNWRKWQSAKWQLTKSLRQELKEKLKSDDLLDFREQYAEDEKSHISLLQATDIVTSDNGLIVPKDEEKEQCLNSSLHHEQLDDGERNLIAPEQNAGSIFHFEADPGAADHEIAMQIEHRDESSHDCAQDQHLQQIALLNDSRNFHMATDSNKTVLAKSDAFPSNLSKYTGNMSHADAPIGGGYPSEIWPAVGLSSAYYHQPKSLSHGYPSISELSLGHAQGRQDQPRQVIDLESEIHQQQRDPHISFLHRQSDGGACFFNQDRNELLLHSLFKDPGSCAYLHEQKQTRSGFHPASSNVMLEPGHFPRNLGSLDVRQKRLGDVYMQQENMHAGGDQLLPLGHIQDWAVNGSVSTHGSGELLSQNWFAGDEGVGGVNTAADENLFSVLSQCNGVRSGGHFDSMVGMERLIQGGNYGAMGSNGMVVARTLNNYMGGGGGYEAESGPRTSQNGGAGGGLQDCVGNPWNHLG